MNPTPFLFMDSETSGFLKRELALGDPGQAWPVSLAAELTDKNGESEDFFSCRIRADGRKIEAAAEGVHGISSRMAGNRGVSSITALGMLVGFAGQANYLIGHSIDFDRKIIESELIRLKKSPDIFIRPSLEMICTMKSSIPVCAIPSQHEQGGYKWPSLDECAEKLLGAQKREGLHGAWRDMQLAKSIFFHLLERNLVEVHI